MYPFSVRSPASVRARGRLMTHFGVVLNDDSRWLIIVKKNGNRYFVFKRRRTFVHLPDEKFIITYLALFFFFTLALSVKDRYTCPSTVWSFAVTMWELLNMARDKPFPHLTNEQVIHNAEQMYYGGELQVSVHSLYRHERVSDSLRQFGFL